MFHDRTQSHPELTPIITALAAARSQDDVIAIVQRFARRVVRSDGIAVVLRNNGFCHYVAEDANQILWSGNRFPLETCVSGWAMLNNETVVVPDVEDDPRVPAAPYATKAIRSLVMVPIGAPKPFAALGAYWCAMVWPDEAAVFSLETIARHAAKALSRLGVAVSAE